MKTTSIILMALSGILLILTTIATTDNQYSPVATQNGYYFKMHS